MKKIVLFLMLFVFVSPVFAQGKSFEPVLSSLEPDNVFEFVVQLHDGLDYHKYVIQQDGVVCDESRPIMFRECGQNLAELAKHMLTLGLIRWQSDLPADVHWSPHDSHYTPVILVVQIKEYTKWEGFANFWHIACSVREDYPEEAICYIKDRLDHHNYAIVASEQVLDLVEEYESN